MRSPTAPLTKPLTHAQVACLACDANETYHGTVTTYFGEDAWRHTRPTDYPDPTPTPSLTLTPRPWP